jgi:hypothetical protein
MTAIAVGDDSRGHASKIQTSPSGWSGAITIAATTVRLLIGSGTLHFQLVPAHRHSTVGRSFRSVQSTGTSETISEVADITANDRSL